MSAAKPDPTSIQLVDPTNLIVRQKSNGFGQEIVCKDKPHEKFTVLMPPMLVSFPSLAGEGTLGSEFTNNEGKLVYVDKRTDAAFKLGLTIGDLNDPELAAMTPPLKQIQRDALTKIYEIGNNIIGSLYDARIDEVRTRAHCVSGRFAPPPIHCFIVYFMKLTLSEHPRPSGRGGEAPSARGSGGAQPLQYMETISGIEADIIATESELMIGRGEPGISGPEDVRERMKTDVALRERIAAKGRAKFIAKTKYKFPNPKEFDEDGNKRAQDGQNKRILLNMKRKAYRRRKEYSKKKASEMPALPLNTQLDTKVRANWLEIREKVATHYEWNPFTFIDAKTGLVLERPIIPVTGRNGKVEMVPDPWWSPIDDSKRTLIALRFMFGVYKVQDAIGVKVIPCPELYIFRQITMSRGAVDLGVFAKMATGVSAGEKRGREEDEAEVVPQAPRDPSLFSIPIPTADDDYDDNE